MPEVQDSMGAVHQVLSPEEWASQEKEGILILRQSDLALYLRCQRSFYLQFVRGARRKKQTGPRKCTTADIGTLVHMGLADYYRSDMVWDEDDLRERMTLHADANMGVWPQEWDGEFLPDDWVSGIALAARMVHGYIPWVEENGLDLRYNTLEVERQYLTVFDSMGIGLSGIIDLVQEDELLGHHVITDHKTKGSGDFRPPRRGDWQLLTYAALYQWETGQYPAAAQWNMLKRVKRTASAKPPFYFRQPIRLSPEQIHMHQSRLFYLLASIGCEIRSSVVVGETSTLWPNFGKHCDWQCPASEVCEAMDALVDWEHLLGEYETTVTINDTQEEE